MAIMHLSVTVIKRSAGRNAVAAAAYRACTRLHDERQDIAFDYSQKKDLVQEAIFLPEDAPSRFSNRETLWNEVEATEKRKDSRLSREVQIALPLELTDEQNWALATEYVKTHFVSKGMIADVAFHAGHEEEQPHLHVMLTLREVTERGFGKSAREWNQRELVTEWRKGWADLCNEHLARHGHDMRIDHRSNEERGIELIPQNKIGVSATRAKREDARGVSRSESERLAEHQRIAEANGNAIIGNPSIALDTLSRQQSTFSDADIARVANRQSSDAEQFTAVYQAILQSTELVSLGKNSQHEMRYTSREMLEIEANLIADVTKMASQSRHAVAQSLSDNAIKTKTLSPSQGEVLKALVHGSDVVAVIGFAGTGKTHLLGAAREAWEDAGYNVRGLALAGRAADGLLQEAGINSRTIASHLLAWQNDRERLSKNDILVIDEAGMVDSRLLSEVIGFAQKAGAKVALVGDHTQLQPIGAGAAFRAILERIGFASLTDIRRQEVDWMRDASKDLALGRTKSALAAYAKKGFVHEYATQDEALQGTVDSWWNMRDAQPDATATMSAYMRKDVAELNALGRSKLRDAGKLGDDIELTINNGKETLSQPFATGDEIYFLKNEKGLGVTGVDDTPFGVKNGTRGIITAATKDRLSVEIIGDKPRTITFDVKDYNHFDYAYAATVHKLQGANFTHTEYFPSYNADRYLSHVALTRHKKTCNIHWSKEGFHYGYRSLESSMAREQVKDFTLDYTTPRGINAPLVDVDNILINEAHTDAAKDWTRAVDFAALAGSTQPEVIALVVANDNLNIINKQHAQNSLEYRAAQAQLVTAALEIKLAHKEQNILSGFSPEVVSTLTEHPALDTLGKGVTQLRPTIPKQLEANLDTHLEAVLSSFDWKAIEGDKDKHPAIATLATAKTEYETIKTNSANVITKQEAAVKKAIRDIVENENVYREVTKRSATLVEPLADIKQVGFDKLTAKEQFSVIYDALDWKSLKHHAKQSASINQLLTDKANLERAYQLKNDKLIKLRQETLMKDLGKLETLPNIKEKVLSLAPEIKTPMAQAHQLYEQHRSLSRNHNQGIGL